MAVVGPVVWRWATDAHGGNRQESRLATQRQHVQGKQAGLVRLERELATVRRPHGRILRVRRLSHDLRDTAMDIGLPERKDTGLPIKLRISDRTSVLRKTRSPD